MEIKTFLIRLPEDLHAWLKQQKGGMNASIVESVKRYKAAKEAEDVYSIGFNDGYAKGKDEEKK